MAAAAAGNKPSAGAAEKSQAIDIAMETAAFTAGPTIAPCSMEIREKVSVPQVASPSANHHAHRSAQANTARPADRGGSSPFESLLDDNSSATAPQPAPTAGAAPGKASAPATTGAPAADGDAGKPDGEQTQAATNQAANVPAVADEAAPGSAAVPADAAKAGSTDTDPAKTDPAKTDTAKTDGGSDANANGSAVVAVDAAALVDAAVVAVATPVVTQATQQPAAAGAAVNTTVQGAAATAPTQPAFIAAAAAQKLQALDGKAPDGKAIDKTKPGPASAPDDGAKATVPGAADGKTAAPQGIQPAPAPGTTPDTKPAAAGKDSTVKADPHHAKPDAASSLAAHLDAATTPSGADPAGGVQAATGASAPGAATAGTAAQTAGAVPAAPQGPPVPLSGLAIEIVGKAQAGNNHFAIRLDPPELGRIEVKLSVDRQGQVTSHLIADRTDTLDLLRRDSGGLERALQNAGLKTSGDGLQFSLRDQSFAGGQNGGGRATPLPVVSLDEALPTLDLTASSYTRYIGRIGGVDIRV
jgi:flagellar hook-length control protein FliK